MEKKPRVYVNNCRLSKLFNPQETKSGAKTVGLVFDGPSRRDPLDDKAFTCEQYVLRMWLTEEDNEKNRKVLETLGATNPPAVVNSETITQKIEGLGSRVVDLVAETDGQYTNIKYVNPCKFGVSAYNR